MSGADVRTLIAELAALKLSARADWLAACVADFPGASPAAQLEHAVRQLLAADLRLCAGAPALPDGIGSVVKSCLAGSFVLQIDELVDVARKRDERAPDAPAGAHRLLKARLSDGFSSVSAIEYEPLPALSPAPARGAKLLVSNPVVRRGLLLLAPDNTRLLGGGVRALEEALGGAEAAAAAACQGPARPAGGGGGDGDEHGVAQTTPAGAGPPQACTALVGAGGAAAAGSQPPLPQPAAARAGGAAAEAGAARASAAPPPHQPPGAFGALSPGQAAARGCRPLALPAGARAQRGAGVPPDGSGRALPALLPSMAPPAPRTAARRVWACEACAARDNAEAAWRCAWCDALRAEYAVLRELALPALPAGAPGSADAGRAPAGPLGSGAVGGRERGAAPLAQPPPCPAWRRPLPELSAGFGCAPPAPSGAAPRPPPPHHLTAAHVAPVPAPHAAAALPPAHGLLALAHAAEEAAGAPSIVELFSAEWQHRLASGACDPFALRLHDVSLAQTAFVNAAAEQRAPGAAPGGAERGAGEVHFELTVKLSAPAPALACAAPGQPRASTCAKLAHGLALRLVGLSAGEMLRRMQQPPEQSKAAKRQVRKAVEQLRGAVCDAEVRSGTAVLLGVRGLHEPARHPAPAGGLE